MAMISMRRSKQELKEGSHTVQESPGNRDKYPYGLEIGLETESLEKLGLSATDVVVKQSFTITAMAIVESVSVNQNQGNEKIQQSIRLQITDMELTPGKKPGNNSLNAIKSVLRAAGEAA